ncbi:MAG: heavy metal translocating P-type ATPase [Candidatus Promineifilaceae bacterium]
MTPVLPISQTIASLGIVQVGHSPWQFWRSRKRQTLPQRLAIAIVEDQPRDEEQEINRHLIVSGVSCTAAIVGSLIAPPLGYLCVPGILYTSSNIWRAAYQALVKERKFTMVCADAVMIPMIIFSGYVISISFAHTLYYISRKLILNAQDNSKTQLVNILGDQPRSVWIRTANGAEVEIAFEMLAVGDTLIVDAGQTIAIDGVIIQGLATIDERMLTGESQPVEKQAGEHVFASTIVLQGSIDVQVETAGDQTIAAQIGTVLQQTADYKSSVQIQGEVLGNRVALPLIMTGVLGYMMVSTSAALAILQAPIVNTLRLASPLALLGYLQQGVTQGILIKDGRALELLNEVDTVVFDKTGTLTEEQPNVGAIHLSAQFDQTTVLRLAAAAEQKQTHPIAKSILAEAEKQGLTLPSVESTAYKMGYGLTVMVEQQSVQVGSQRFMELSDVTIPQTIQQAQRSCHQEGYALIYVAIDGVLAGAIELHPTIRQEVPKTVDRLRQRGLATYIISGDREEPTRRMAERLGIDHYFAETLPEDKADLIAQLQAQGKKVCFIGDGINDSIALKKANVPISLSGATNVATDTAQVVLLDGSLKQLVPLFDLAAKLDKTTQRTVLASAVPSTVIIGGAFFFGLGIYSAIVLYNLSLIMGVANALTPMLNAQTGEQQGQGIITDDLDG